VRRAALLVLLPACSWFFASEEEPPPTGAADAGADVDVDGGLGSPCDPTSGWWALYPDLCCRDDVLGTCADAGTDAGADAGTGAGTDAGPEGCIIPLVPAADCGVSVEGRWDQELSCCVPPACVGTGGGPSSDITIGAACESPEGQCAWGVWECVEAGLRCLCDDAGCDCPSRI
jgi:hypothetical protein